MEHKFYLFSHIFFTVSDQTSYEKSECTCNCKRQKSSTYLVLSTLALSKHSELYSENGCILSGRSNYINDTQNEGLNIGQAALVNQVNTEGEEGATKTISAMSYNIWNFNAYEHSSSNQDEYAERFEKILNLLRKTQPDIAGFQEVRYEHASGGRLGPNQIDHLVSALPGYQVHVFNTHLSLSHEAREKSVSQIMQFMKEASGNEPALLMGDLNASPEEKAIRMLSESSDLEDIWLKLHPSSKGFTFNNLEDHLSKRIDYIFLKKPTKMTAVKMEVLSDGIKSKAASDHRPVVATLGFKT
ncbi:hypothetical protein EGW08_018093 [Elysia chlorotica]|uniref:Endonuclease/exonuclease/phosphatase domain-containing protein n=1 Tax=Elysia chlorotica TaxID=188477 RepID=A0A3S1B3I7_ELYCH|nr:hypothetical protein EGW08_018093 [Elysia chlorotica]